MLAINRSLKSFRNHLLILESNLRSIDSLIDVKLVIHIIDLLGRLAIIIDIA